MRLLQALADSTSIALENVQIFAEMEARILKRTEELAAANQHLMNEIEERHRAEAAVRQLSLTDELTGIYNRRGFRLLADRALESARRRGDHCHLLYLDLDGLKLLNDAQGHAAGDAMIVAAAQLLQNVFRKTDIVARLGGDEFGVLATDRNEPSYEILQRLGVALSNENRLAARDPRLSFSAGHVDIAPVDRNVAYVHPLETLLAMADSRMYADKTARRAARQVA